MAQRKGGLFGGDSAAAGENRPTGGRNWDIGLRHRREPWGQDVVAVSRQLRIRAVYIAAIEARPVVRPARNRRPWVSYAPMPIIWAWTAMPSSATTGEELAHRRSQRFGDAGGRGGGCRAVSPAAPAAVLALIAWPPMPGGYMSQPGGTGFQLIDSVTGDIEGDRRRGARCRCRSAETPAPGLRRETPAPGCRQPSRSGKPERPNPGSNPGAGQGSPGGQPQAPAGGYWRPAGLSADCQRSTARPMFCPRPTRAAASTGETEPTRCRASARPCHQPSNAATGPDGRRRSGAPLPATRGRGPGRSRQLGRDPGRCRCGAVAARPAPGGTFKCSR